MTPSDRLELIGWYAEQDRALLRLNGKKPCDENGALLPEWEKHQLPREHLAEVFATERWNVGIKTGAPSSGLVDVDLDCPEALELAPLFLPPASTFGRASKPRSHWLYIVNEPCPLERIKDERKPGAKDGETMLELRGNGGQTMFPPSVHPDEPREEVTWTQDPDEPDHPPTVPLATLYESWRALGAACFVARYAGMDAARAFAERGTMPELPPLVRLRVAELLGVVTEAAPRSPNAQPTVGGWIAAVNARGVAEVAEALGLTRMRGGSWGPCPACTADKRGSKEKRGAIGLRRDGAGWECHACKTKGDPLALAAWVLLERRPSAGEREAWRVIRTGLESRGVL